MNKNAVGRMVPDSIPGIKNVVPYKGAFAHIPEGKASGKPLRLPKPGESKILGNLEETLDAVGIKDGMTISFHHHLRNGDHVVNMVMDAIAARGIRDITIAPSALFSVHKNLIQHIDSGVIRTIWGSVNGPIGRRVSAGAFKQPVILRSHGGRARAVEADDMTIDVAFLAAPACDHFGNISGKFGPSACGALGYAVTDARAAETVVALTDNLQAKPLGSTLIDQTMIDYILPVPHIGDPKGIVSGTTQITKDPGRLLIAHYAAELAKASGLVKEGFSFQTGAGGISLAVTKYIRDIMIAQKITARFGSGGITGYFVDMLEEGLIETLFDVQSFDLAAVASIARNAEHHEMSASMYANIHNAGCLVNQLDVVILGATEVDLDFNVNVNTEADGELLHGIGGHQDTAAGAKLTIITAPLIRGRIPLISESVQTITSPGETIDAIVTDQGMAINPRRPELAAAAIKAGLPVKSIEELHQHCLNICGKPDAIEFEDEIVAVIEYRDGTILDTVRKVHHSS